MTGSRDAKELAECLRKEGYQVTISGSTHYRVSNGDKRYDFPFSPSDVRSLTNACSSLKRNDFVFTFRGKRWGKAGLLSPAEEAARRRALAKANAKPEPDPEPVAEPVAEPEPLTATDALELVLPGRFRAVHIPAVKRWLLATEKLLGLR